MNTSGFVLEGEMQTMALTVPSRFRHHQEQRFAQSKTFLLATFLGLGWFPLAYISAFLGNGFASLFFHYHFTRGQPVDNPALLCNYLTLIVLSTVVYLGLFPLLIGVHRGDYKMFLRSIGLMGISNFGFISVILALTTVAVLIVIGVFPLFFGETYLPKYH